MLVFFIDCENFLVSYGVVSEVLGKIKKSKWQIQIRIVRAVEIPITAMCVKKNSSFSKAFFSASACKAAPSDIAATMTSPLEKFVR